MVKEVKLRQPEKAKSPIEVTLLGMVKEVKLRHPSKAELPMEVTPSPNTTFLIDVIFLNQEEPMLRHNMVTEVKLLQPEKASLPITVTLLGMVTEVKPVQL